MLLLWQAASELQQERVWAKFTISRYFKDLGHQPLLQERRRLEDSEQHLPGPVSVLEEFQNYGLWVLLLQVPQIEREDLELRLLSKRQREREDLGLLLSSKREAYLVVLQQLRVDVPFYLGHLQVWRHCLEVPRQLRREDLEQLLPLCLTEGSVTEDSVSITRQPMIHLWALVLALLVLVVVLALPVPEEIHSFRQTPLPQAKKQVDLLLPNPCAKKCVDLLRYQ